MHPVRPRLKPALRRFWRDGTTLQFGLDPTRAVVIAGLDRRRAQLVDRLDGTVDVPALHAVATTLGLTGGAVDDLLGLLGGSGLLEDAAGDEDVWNALDREERDRLAPDVSAASIARTHAPSGVSVLARRQGAAVGVLGSGRVGASVATLLAAAGIGTVVVDDAATTRPADLAPAGLTPEQLGARRQDAATRTLRRAAPSVRTRLPATRRIADLVILASDGGATDARHGERLVRSGVAHLYAGVRDATGIVGPLVLPGQSSCLRCHDLHRSDRDPAWPSIAAQLAVNGRHRVETCDVVLATAVAAHAGLQVLAAVDGDGTPSAVDGTIEIAQADGRTRRRSWLSHPACGCSWGAPDPD